MALVPVNEKEEKVELTEKQSLMLLKKDELSDMIIAQKLKYKKLDTKNKNTNKSNKETENIIEEAAETILKLTSGYELANEEAAAMSDTLKRKNLLMKETNEIVTDMLHGIDLVLKQGMKLLEANGIFIEGGLK